MTEKDIELREEAFKCIRCGLCQTVCPIYAEVGAEQTVARGKVRLFREVLDGNVGVTPRFKEIMSLCLNCKACVANCPPLVHTDKLVLAARAKVAEKHGLPFPLKTALRNFIINNSAQGAMTRMANLYKLSGMQKVLRKTGMIRAVSRELAQMESMMPEFGARSFRSMLPDIKLKKGGKIKVAYYLSCMTNMVNGDLGKAVIKVLEKHGCEVIIPADVKCCGTPHLAYGDVETARELARHNIDLLLNAGADVIVSDCATCGDALRNYGELVPEAGEAMKKVQDISQFLVSLGLIVGDKPVDAVVTYHDSCHLNRGQGVTVPPRTILKAIPGVTFKEMPEADRCCGGAGSFGLTHYDVSMKILDRKVRNIGSVSPTMVATGCPACKMQIEHGLERAGLQAKVVHPVELLARTYGDE